MKNISLIGKHGGYKKLKTFKLARLIYDITNVFCEKYIEKKNRTRDQMIQAARSGVQNIAEGSAASATSKKTEIKLTSVAKASLEELKLDYEDFLRQKTWEPLPPGHPAMLRFKERRCATLSDVRSWIHEEHKISRKTPANSIASNFTAQSPCMSVSVRARQCKSVSSPSPQSFKPHIPGVFTHSYLAANAALSLLNLTTFLLRKQLDSLGRDFLEEGGFSERIYKQRKQYTNQQKRRNSV